MEWLTTILSAQAVAEFENVIESWGLVVFLGFFALELLRLWMRRTLNWKLAGDSLASFLTSGAFVVLTYGFIAAAYVSVFYWVHLNFALLEIPVTPWSVALLVVLCDFAYYWEHRFTHRVGLAWATHSVHHSSPFFNISVAYRFGPMDGVWPLFFHLPLAFAGFDPLLIFAGEAFVQFYQTGLHTEVIRRLPRPIEWLFNTPSHHRVHHGANAEYIDKNYSGIFILWDRLFGTFAEERDAVRFGITEPLNSNNPVTVWLHGFTRLARRAGQSTSFREAVYALVAPPEWRPGQTRTGPQTALLPVTLVALLAGAALSYAASPEGEKANDTGLAAQSAAASAPTGGVDQNAPRSVTDRYYQALLNGDEAEMASTFTADAYLHYKMDFGGYYGSTEFGYRADAIDSIDDGGLEGYEGFNGRYKILSVATESDGATVVAEFTEQYRWDGYSGTMQSRETLRLVNVGGVFRIRRLDAEQRYR